MDFICSDLHINHFNIIKYANRPFSSTEEMNKSIINNWNSTVKDIDRVFLLGDVMFSRNINEILDLLLNKLKGKIILILGNHDLPLEKLFNENKYREVNKKLFIAGHMLDIKVDVGYNNFQKVVMCHYSLYNWNRQFHGSYSFYGHVHNNTVTEIKNSFNVCCEVLNYKPTLIRDIIKNN